MFILIHLGKKTDLELNVKANRNEYQNKNGIWGGNRLKGIASIQAGGKIVGFASGGNIPVVNNSIKKED